MAISAFKGIACTIQLPANGFTFADGFKVPPNGDAILGAHEIALVGYAAARGAFKAYAWGGIYDMPVIFFVRYALECNAFPSLWLTPQRLAANGFSWERLINIAASVKV